MPHFTHYLPELQESERTYVQSLVGQFSHEQLETFAALYRQRRKDPQTVLLAAIVGLVAIPGFQRFWVGEVGVGIVFLCTAGALCVGSICDLVQYKTLALLYNQKVAREVATTMQSSSNANGSRSFDRQQSTK